MTTRERTWDLENIGDRLPPGWEFQQDAIIRFYETDGWPTTLMAVNAIGFLCEAADHHPDLTISWGKLSVRLNTHTAGGVTDKALELLPGDYVAVGRRTGYRDVRIAFRVRPGQAPGEVLVQCVEKV